MKKSQLIFVVITICFSLLLSTCQKTRNYNTTKELLRAMKTKNDSNWFRHFTFKQHTLFFDKSGKQTNTTIWYEAISYPYFFRIDRDLKGESYTIYRNDSTYHFRKNSLLIATNEPTTNLLLKGGLYFISLEESMKKLKKYNINTQAFQKDVFMGNPVYIIGNEGNQFWIHANNFYTLRRTYTTKSNGKVDVIYENYIPLGNGWIEQKVTFYIDEKKLMEEFYFDIKVIENLDLRVYSISENYKLF